MDKKIYRCLIASPSDTAQEREMCDKVFSEINKGIGVAYNFTLESLKFEKDIYPALGEDAQDVINKQIDGKYDLFIGIMFTRFGSKTKRADSGTEEEFNNAFKLAKENKKKDFEIMFYFNEAPRPANADLKQLKKVEQFRKKVVSTKGLYWTYNGISDFERILRNHLHLYFNKIYTQTRDTYQAIINSIDINNTFGFENVFIHSILSIEEENNYYYEIFRTIKLTKDLNHIDLRPSFGYKCTIELHSDLVDVPPLIESDENGVCRFKYPLNNNKIGDIITIHYAAKIPLKAPELFQMTSENSSLTEIHDIVIKKENHNHPGELYMRELTSLPNNKGKLIKTIPFDSRNRLYRITLDKPPKGVNYIFYW